jgi:cytochrome c biogenesis protein ResB
MFLWEQQARKQGWPNYDEYACAQCRARADPQQVAASTMFMYLYLYLGFSVTQCIMHSDLPMFVLLQADKQKQQEEEAARKKKAEEEAAAGRSNKGIENQT